MPEQNKLKPWEDPEQLPGLISEAWTKAVAARKALNIHIQIHGGKYLQGCHNCPKLTVQMMDEESEYNSLNARLDQMRS
jgi:hypothetical protein